MSPHFPQFLLWTFHLPRKNAAFPYLLRYFGPGNKGIPSSPPHIPRLSPFHIEEVVPIHQKNVPIERSLSSAGILTRGIRNETGNKIPSGAFFDSTRLRRSFCRIWIFIVDSLRFINLTITAFWSYINYLLHYLLVMIMEVLSLGEFCFFNGIDLLLSGGSELNCFSTWRMFVG